MGLGESFLTGLRYENRFKIHLSQSSSLVTYIIVMRASASSRYVSAAESTERLMSTESRLCMLLRLLMIPGGRELEIHPHLGMVPNRAVWGENFIPDCWMVFLRMGLNKPLQVRSMNYCLPCMFETYV